MITFREFYKLHENEENIDINKLISDIKKIPLNKRLKMIESEELEESDENVENKSILGKLSKKALNAILLLSIIIPSMSGNAEAFSIHDISQTTQTIKSKITQTFNNIKDINKKEKDVIEKFIIQGQKELKKIKQKDDMEEIEILLNQAVRNITVNKNIDFKQFETDLREIKNQTEDGVSRFQLINKLIYTNVSKCYKEITKDDLFRMKAYIDSCRCFSQEIREKALLVVDEYLYYIMRTDYNKRSLASFTKIYKVQNNVQKIEQKNPDEKDKEEMLRQKDINKNIDFKQFETDLREIKNQTEDDVSRFQLINKLIYTNVSKCYKEITKDDLFRMKAYIDVSGRVFNKEIIKKALSIIDKYLYYIMGTDNAKRSLASFTKIYKG